MKVELKAFWDSLYTSPFYTKFLEYFVAVFSHEDIERKYDLVEIWSVFGSVPPPSSNPRVLRVQFSGEPGHQPSHHYDMNLIDALPSTEKGNIVIPHTLAGMHFYVHDLFEKLNKPRVWNADDHRKRRFCTFIVSNGGPIVRKLFFVKLSEFKHIDSCGRFANNCNNMQIPECDSDEYYDFLRSFRFMMCFENSHIDYYLTEKLINAYIGGCIPIYWGCPQLDSLVNTDAMLVLDKDASEESMQKLYDRVAYLENNEEEYKKVYEQPLFKNRVFQEQFTIEYVQKQVVNALRCI